MSCIRFFWTLFSSLKIIPFLDPCIDLEPSKKEYSGDFGALFDSKMRSQLTSKWYLFEKGRPLRYMHIRTRIACRPPPKGAQNRCKMRSRNRSPKQKLFFEVRSPKNVPRVPKGTNFGLQLGGGVQRTSLCLTRLPLGAKMAPRPLPDFVFHNCS